MKDLDRFKKDVSGSFQFDIVRCEAEIRRGSDPESGYSNRLPKYREAQGFWARLPDENIRELLERQEVNYNGTKIVFSVKSRAGGGYEYHLDFSGEIDCKLISFVTYKDKQSMLEETR